MERTKRIISGLLIAFAGALLAIFLYAKVVDRPQVVVRESSPLLLANNMAPESPQTQVPDLTMAAEKSVHAMVHVMVKMKSEQTDEDNPLYDFFFGPGNRQRYRQQEPQYRMAEGSGVILSPDGYIVTNNHVVDESINLQVVTNDGHEYKAKVIGRDPNTDIALIKIEGKNLPYLTWGNSDALKLGEWVLAVGNPFNLTSTVTAGIVSAKSRSLNIIQGQKLPLESFIQTDAAVNPGNSGGALVDSRGNLVGINTAIASQTGSYTGYAFAVPSMIAKKVVDDIMRYGQVQRAVLGVEIKNVNDSIAKANKLANFEGVYVHRAVPGGSADKAGIKKGDLILAINGNKVNNTQQLIETIWKYTPGTEVTVTIRRNGQLKDVKVTLQAAAQEKSQGSKVEMSSLGAEFGPISDRDKEKLQIDNGVQVTNLSKGKLRDAGVRKGFIITDINKQPVSNPDDVDEIVSQSSSRKPILVEGVYPNGEWAYYIIKPE
jgi:Do/DeqQ family serine protease